MTRTLTLAASLMFGTGICLFSGCADQNSAGDRHGDSMNSPASPAAGAGYNNGSAAGIPDNASGGSTGIPTDGTGANRFGNQSHSGTLGGGTVHDPNANTPGGGN